MKTTRKSDSQIMQILSQADSGVPVSELCREHSMSSTTFYKWRAKYGGMDTSMITSLKELELELELKAENTRLKKMYADERLKAMIVQEVLTKKF
jgi:putative transposase